MTANATLDVAPPGLDERISGPLLLALTVMVTIGQWGGPDWAEPAGGLLLVPVTVLFALRAGWMQLIFVSVSGLLILAAALSHANWIAETSVALQRGAFIAAYFAALTTLRHAADTSPAIRTCGLYLAHQSPGRRYIALTAGGQMFALLLNYGAIALLGSLAASSAATEPDPERRRHRTRRMLIAVQRGFGSALPWSPLAFAVALTSTLVPGVSWARALPYAIGTSFLLVVIGWALDTIFKPRLPRPAQPPARAPGSWRSLLPLFLLLGVLMGIAIGLHLVTELPITGIVLLIVPAIATLWFALQAPKGARAATAAGRLRDYVSVSLPNYRDQLLLIYLAGFIGSLAASLLLPVIDATGFDLATVPGWVILAGLVWVIPIAGQLGMNPLLSVTLIAPLVPVASVIGVTPTAIFIAITGGWALTAASSPFTATTLLLGDFSGVSSYRVAWAWNGAYTLISAVAISVYVIVLVSLGAG